MLRKLFRLVGSGRDVTELSDAVEHPFDPVSIPTRSEVAGSRVLPVGFRRSDRSAPLDQELLAQDSAVIAFAGQ
jgi:hypothetical protein